MFPPGDVLIRFSDMVVPIVFYEHNYFGITWIHDRNFFFIFDTPLYVFTISGPSVWYSLVALTPRRVVAQWPET